MLIEAHVTNNVWTKRTGGVGENRATKSGMKFFSDGGAAGLRTAFEHQGFVSSFGEVESGDQPIVATADDNDIALFGHG
jgi:hypothetical protein